jgi:hypothetical protein
MGTVNWTCVIGETSSSSSSSSCGSPTFWTLEGISASTVLPISQEEEEEERELSQTGNEKSPN